MTDLENWQVLLWLFPSEWRQLGKSTGAVRRLRGFPSLDAVLRTLLLHIGCGWSLRETAVQAKLAGIAEVSDVTLLNRLRDAEPWLQQMCQQLWKENGVWLEAGFGSRPVRLLDATVVREPGKTGSEWRIHYSLRLPTLECDHFDLTSTRGAGTGERFGRFSFQPGELVLADAGYCHPAGIAAVVAAKADLCVRLSPYGLPLYDERDKPFPLLKRLGRLRKAGDLAHWPVWIKSGDSWIAGRVCAIRKSQDAILKAQRRLILRRQAGKKVGPATRRYPVRAGLHHPARNRGNRRTGARSLPPALADRADLQAPQVHRPARTLAQARPTQQSSVALRQAPGRLAQPKTRQGWKSHFPLGLPPAANVLPPAHGVSSNSPSTTSSKH